MGIMGIFAAFPGEGASNDNGNEPEANIIIWYLVLCRLSTDPKMLDLE